MGLLQAVRAQAIAASDARELLRDDLVTEVLREAALRLRKERQRVLRANDADVAAAIGKLDNGAIDRLRLDSNRLDIAEEQLLALAELPSLEREADCWSLPNGLVVSERRIPVGVIGANFEARPLVALDIASQLLKSLNAGLLRTGGAALQTVTELVDHVLHPALAEIGVPPAVVGLVRSKDQAGAVALVSLPEDIPLVILHGRDPRTAELAQHAAIHGVQTLAHAEGGGVLYVDEHGDPRLAQQIVFASLDRLAVCNRLNLLLVHQRADCASLIETLRQLGIEPCGTARARAVAGMPPVDVPLRHEWAVDAGARRSRQRPCRRLAGGGAHAYVRSRRRDRHRQRARGNGVPRRLPRNGGILARSDAVRRRICPDRRVGDGH